MGEKSRLETLWQLWPNTFRMDQGTAYVGKGHYIPGDKVVIDNPRKISYGISGRWRPHRLARSNGYTRHGRPESRRVYEHRG